MPFDPDTSPTLVADNPSLRPPKPMLAGKGPDLRTLENWPYTIQTKIDGIRCLISNRKAYGRSGKLLPNECLQELVREEGWYHGLDGELCYKEDYSSTMTAVMSHHYPLDKEMVYYVFDWWNRGYEDYNLHGKRMFDIMELHERSKISIGIIAERTARSPEEVVELSTTQIFRDASPEGFILRNRKGRYKHGRSTRKEEFLLKYKNFQDAEAIILDFIPLYTNENAPEKDEFGHQVRSSHKANKVQQELLGAFVVELLDGSGAETRFKVGTGFDAEQREEYWKHRHNLIGKVITFTHLPAGAQALPRFPVFKGFRDPIDLDWNDETPTVE